ncbi:MAG: hypothetical protein GXO10_04345 [Crenarchaeota archaeon]|nr:hypothetical protein [Thermoproteota archaeon]
MENRLRNIGNIHVRKVEGKIFIGYTLDGRVLGLGGTQFRFVRELADMILCLNLEGKCSVIFVQLKNSRINLSEIISGKQNVERLIGHYDPSLREVRNADKGQLLLLSGFLERVLALRGFMSMQDVCARGMFARIGLPSHVRFMTYPYYSANSSNRVNLGGHLTVRYSVRYAHMLYIFSYVDNDTLHVTSQRAGDLLYFMSRRGRIRVPATVEERFAKEELGKLLSQHNITSIQQDVHTTSMILNESPDSKIRYVQIFMRELGLRYLFTPRSISPLAEVFPRVATSYFGTYNFASLGEALDHLIREVTGRADQSRSQFGIESSNIIIEYDSQLSSFTIRDLNIGTDISRFEYELETEGLDWTLIVEVSLHEE